MPGTKSKAQVALQISELIPTQAGLRNWDLVYALAESVCHGWKFDRDETPLISISRFEDGARYVHNGHHRVMAIHLGGRAELLPGEYVETEYRYAQYEEWRPEVGWLTPFDPRTEMRAKDLNWVKTVVLALIRDCSVDVAEKFVRAHRWFYTVKRYARTIGGIATIEGDPRLEELAAVEHEQWVSWTRHLLEVEPGISAARRAKWEALFVPYADLPEDEKEKDREWARRAHAVLWRTLPDPRR